MLNLTSFYCSQGINLYLSSVDNFFRKFNVKTSLNRSNIRKLKGVHPIVILSYIIALPFIGKNFYQGIANNHLLPFKKDVAYSFLRSEKFNWRKFLILLSVKIISFIDSLTNKSRYKVLILDDSTIEKPRSKVVELLARVFDHANNRYLKGFRFLNLSWSDGFSFIPIDFCLLSSQKKHNRYKNITKTLDKRTCGYKRRKEALSKITDLIVPLVSRALNAGIKADYLLMDSWFGLPSIISQLHQHINVICMLKKTSKVLYQFNGSLLTLTEIYSKLKKRRGKAHILTSTQVTLKNNLPAKIVFVRNKKNSDWLAILSTDIHLEDSEIVRLYGRRWDIEVFFKMAKQFLCLENGTQARDFDSLIAHTSIVLLRYQFLIVEYRRQNDQRSFGALFRACCDEMKDLTFYEALQRILEIVGNCLKLAGEYAEEIYNQIVPHILNTAMEVFSINQKILLNNSGT